MYLSAPSHVKSAVDAIRFFFFAAPLLLVKLEFRSWISYWDFFSINFFPVCFALMCWRSASVYYLMKEIEFPAQFNSHFFFVYSTTIELTIPRQRKKKKKTFRRRTIQQKQNWTKLVMIIWCVVHCLLTVCVCEIDNECESNTKQNTNYYCCTSKWASCTEFQYMCVSKFSKCRIWDVEVSAAQCKIRICLHFDGILWRWCVQCSSSECNKVEHMLSLLHRCI